ncbi:MAG TPA: type II toxin-antitoxin system prevent-host-death family antitoxin [Opitutaceae bacterium]|nr:type II toxin-antitoxin system prevent-host-death family antitoxin [Opitutaceae bacterium]
MTTKWMASRELSASPGKALASVAKAGRVLVTVNGKPKAILIPTSEETFARDLELLDRVSLAGAIAGIRADSVREGTDSLTPEEIDVEVAAVRAARKRR